MQSALVEDLHCGLEADTFDAANQVGGRNAAVLENHVAGVGAFLAHLLVDLAQRQARGAGFNDECRDAACTLDLRVAAGHDGENARVRGIGDKALGAVEHIAVAVTHSTGAQRRRVGAGARFGQRERADQFTRGHARQVVALLRLGAVDDQALGADAVVGADQGAEGRGGLAQFEGHQDLFFHAQAKAIVVLGNAQAEQAQFTHFLDDGWRYAVVFRHRMFGGHQPFADETRQAVEQQVECFLIVDHARPLGVIVGPEWLRQCAPGARDAVPGRLRACVGAARRPVLHS
ncbi:hypothetical protein D3C81_842390 [compost metagenome]